MKTGIGATSRFFRPFTGAALTAVLGLVGVPAAAAAQGVVPQVSCYQRATDGGLDDALATQLCRGARSSTPADCFVRAQDEGSLTQSQAVQLCQFAAPDEDPAACYIQARKQTFTAPTRVLQLCQPAVQTCPGNVE
ncbi:hypothetical protein MXAN_3137 [Myxococcus xanthus DK 1622]|uniref:Lipoprotein n=1 Tax=Myxococcus xanthus (strain DK1622) TaxID=246197 RepID=Q1D7N3_MYXXD|nr:MULTISPECIES: hypothetical protein [Myxococcus]ABF87060.1 hypothetical protein MXAN_3137 [Myxococcus xanthus DK 1622]NOJ52928.1 hypothetical protein [Myxococcus xanthus]QPM82592.1 hypothetical protein I5Q59_15530 [Myxococcus xanthus]QVW64897.1 hypothetical protein JTM82_20875 [Myxococcus xanthus DZ2]QZZ50846.1 hypothetical protein MyxoNM_16705 [Myxococcus xanthus]